MLNPKAVVPTIIHEGNVIRESTLIMEYLDAVFLEPPLMPADPYLKFRARLFLKMMEEKTKFTHAGAAAMTVFLETMRLYFRLRDAGKQSGLVTPGGGIWGFLDSLAMDGPQTVPQLALVRPVSRQHIQ